MAIALEIAWTSATIAANVANTGFTINMVGGGAELIWIPFIVDTSNSCTGGTLASHANLSPGASFTATVANGYVMGVAWGIYAGPSGNQTFTLTYNGGNSGTTGGKIQTGVFTGYGAVSASAPNANASGSASPAAVTLSGVNAGDAVVALMSNVGAHNWSAGSGYTLVFNTSAWSGNVTGLEATTGLSEPGGSPIIQASFPSGPSNWNMMAATIRGPTPPATGSLVYSQRKVLYFI